VLISLGPNADAICLADPQNAGSGICTDRADRIDPTVERLLQQRDDARLACPAPPDTHFSHSESIPHDTVKRAVSRLFSQIVA